MHISSLYRLPRHTHGRVVEGLSELLEFLVGSSQFESKARSKLDETVTESLELKQISEVVGSIVRLPRSMVNDIANDRSTDMHLFHTVSTREFVSALRKRFKTYPLKKRELSRSNSLCFALSFHASVGVLPRNCPIRRENHNHSKLHSQAHFTQCQRDCHCGHCPELVELQHQV